MASTRDDDLRRLFRENFRLGRSERVLVFADRPGRGERVGKGRYRCARAAAAVAGEMGGEALFVDYDPTGTHGAEPPEELWEACFGGEAAFRLRKGGLLGRIMAKKASSRDLAAAGRIIRGKKGQVPDVVLAMSHFSTSHTRFRSLACTIGEARYGSMPLFDPKMLKGPMAVDWKEVARRTRKGAALLSRARRIRVHSPNGTALRFDTGGRKAHADDGLLHRPGAFGNLPAGECFLAPMEGKAQGVLVAEWSPTERLKKPMALWIRDGLLHEVEGTGPAANLLRRKIRENPDNANVAELGVGTNPGASRPDNILEAEKILGTIHVAFGDNHGFGGRVSTPFHQDYVVFKASLVVELPDGRRREILREGKWVLS
jgi:leucyl aminopeptidase (aminopeptidase T)